MQHVTKALALGALAAAGQLAAASASAAAVTPVEKVLQLMDGMLAKGKKEKHEEEVQFAAYNQFCADTSVEKKRAIEEANEKIEVLNADIEKYTATAERLTREIAEHDENIAAWNGDQKAATQVRRTQKADYDTLHQDYSESISALVRAVDVLKKQAYDRKQAASLVQVSALKKLRLVPESAKRAIDALVQQDSAFLQDEAAPEAHGYEFQSHGVVEMLEKLQDKFVEERTAFEKEEMNAKHAYDMLMQDLSAQIKQATQDREEKSMAKAKSLQMKADAQGDLKDTTDTRDADVKYLSDLTAICEQKAADFDSRQQLRAEELEAINKAMDIISGGSVQGSAEKHLPSLAQEGGSVLAMLRASDAQGQLAQGRVAAFLAERSRALNSRILASVAARASSDPFRKVKKMIKDLVVRLMEEANEEAEHKGWCDTELSSNEQTRTEKTEAVETLHAEIDGLEASIAQLTQDINDLNKAVSQLQAAMAEATKLRQEEKAKNTQAIADAQEAQAAVAQALTVLKEFYEKAGDATALVQQQPEAPEIFDKSYKGMQAENGGVVGMLEVIASDFTRLETDTKSQETTAQNEYDAFMTDSKVDLDSKSTDIEHKTSKKQDEEQTLAVKNEDLENTQQELDAALAYFDKLKPSCVDAGVSAEDRVARREEELKSLQEALRILNGEDLA